MDRNLWYRLSTIAAVLGVCLYLVFPTYKYFSKYHNLTQEEVNKLPESQRADYRKTFSKAMKLGLDLQGGMHLVLELETPKGAKPEAKRDAQDRVLEILSTRVDQYGVAEPTLAKQGVNRILIQLPGVDDPEGARNLIGKVAQLEFRMVRDPAEIGRVAQKLDEVIKAARAGAKADSAKAAGAAGTQVAAASDTTKKATNDSLFPDILKKSVEAPKENADAPFSSQFVFFQFGALYVPDDGIRVQRVKEMLDMIQRDPDMKKAVPPGAEFIWSSEDGPPTQDGIPTKLLYMVNHKIELTGETLEDARVSPDPNKPGSMLINFRLNRKGARVFGRVTKENVGKQLAIILDGVVKSAPNIHTPIPNGEGQITGSYTDAQARDLGIVLRAGALPVQVKVIEERSVGPTLGSDSLHKGVRASIIGLAAVALFLSVYYSLSGVLAALGLVYNLVIVMACMAALHASLSLPGIAGMVLSVAMAVDANVLIFERMREELRKAKTVAAAIDAGYKHAFSAIFDSHVTTLCSGMVLFYFGTGTIKGYATTLSIGIVSSLFTSLFVTRFIYDAITRRRQLQKLSIG